MPDTRASSGADAVLTSTPTAFTQSSTTASSDRASLAWSRSCWYWPTPIDLGSILTSSASGSCSRRAIDTAPRRVTSRSGNSSEREGRGRIDRRAGLRHHDLGHFKLGQALDQLGRELVGLARGGAVADRDQLDTMCFAHSFAERSRAPRPTAAAARADRSSSVATTLPVASTTATLTPVRKPGSRPMVDAGAGGRGEQQVAQVGREHAHRFVLGRIPQPHAQVDVEMHLDLGAPGPAHGVDQPAVAGRALRSAMPNRFMIFSS